MGLKRITYSLPILKSLVNSKTACVFCFENSRKCFNTTPAQLANLKVAVKEHLASKVSTYDPEFQGIIMSHKNIRVVNSVPLSDDGEYRLDYIADIYVFKPSVENILTGVVNKKSQDHLGVLVHSFFNATIPRQRVDTECPKIWPGADVKIGEQVTFEVIRVNFLSRLPYIKGQLVGIKGRDVEDRDSGLDHESTEEWSYRSSPPGVGDSDCSEDVKRPKARKKGRSTDSPSPIHPSKKNHSLLELQSSLISEVMASPFHIPTTPINSLSKSLSDSVAKKNPSKKRKRDSSLLLEIENSLLTEAVKRLTSPEVLNEGNQPKVKKKRTSTTLPCGNETFSGSEALGTPQSTTQKLISSEISSLKPKKKKSSLFPSEDISRDAKMSNSVETPKSPTDSSFSHSIKDNKESNKHEQSIYFERDTSLAEEACMFQQKMASPSDPSSSKKCKKKKKESSYIEDLKNDVLTESDDVKIDTRERHKKKKRSMTFQDSAESSTLVEDGLGQRHKFRNTPSVLAPEWDKTESSASTLFHDFYETKKKKKSTKHISFQDLNGSFVNVNLPGVPSEHSSYCYDTKQLNNLSEQKEEDDSLRVNKKKKKRSSAVAEDTESSILERDYSKNEFFSTSISEKLVTLTGGNETDKSFSNTNNDSFQQHKKKKKSVLSHNVDVSSSVVNDISEDSHLEISGLENENFNNLKESKKKKKKTE